MVPELQPLIHFTLTESKEEDCDCGEDRNSSQPEKVPYSQKALQCK